MANVAEPSGRSGMAAGLIAGVIALACCVGPAVGALLGIASAATAIELATDLFSTWGWAFKLAGLAFGAAAVTVAFRRGRACDPHGRGRSRFFAALVVSGLLTYGGLYAGTTWLGDAAAAEAPEIRVTGQTAKEKVSSVLTQARAHYPHFTAEVKGVSSEAVRLEVGLCCFPMALRVLH